MDNFGGSVVIKTVHTVSHINILLSLDVFAQHNSGTLKQCMHFLNFSAQDCPFSRNEIMEGLP